MTSKPKVLYSGSVPQLFSDLDLAGRAIAQIHAEKAAENAEHESAIRAVEAHKVFYAASQQLQDDLVVAGLALEKAQANEQGLISELAVLSRTRNVKSLELAKARQFVATAIQFGADTTIYRAEVSRIQTEIAELDRAIKAELNN